MQIRRRPGHLSTGFESPHRKPLATLLGPLCCDRAGGEGLERVGEHDLSHHGCGDACGETEKSDRLRGADGGCHDRDRAHGTTDHENERVDDQIPTTALHPQLLRTTRIVVSV